MEKKATKLDIKPFSVNDAWKGRRRRTENYKDFENAVFMLAPNGLKIPKGVPLRAIYWWGFSSNGSDYDNPIKPLQDVLSKKYGFNDNQIMQGMQFKEVVPKGQEYVAFLIEPM